MVSSDGSFCTAICVSVPLKFCTCSISAVCSDVSPSSCTVARSSASGSAESADCADVPSNCKVPVSPEFTVSVLMITAYSPESVSPGFPSCTAAKTSVPQNNPRSIRQNISRRQKSFVFFILFPFLFQLNGCFSFSILFYHIRNFRTILNIYF